MNEQLLFNGFHKGPLKAFMMHIDEFTSVNMMMPNTAKNAITIRNDILVRSLEPHVPFLLRFFDDLARISFFDGSFEYIFSGCC